MVERNGQVLIGQNNDHVISGKKSDVTQKNGYVIDLNEESDEDTAGEGGETLPRESTTTDAFTDPLDPIDFIETTPHDYAHHFSSGKGIIQYDHWNILIQDEDGSKKGQ